MYSKEYEKIASLENSIEMNKSLLDECYYFNDRVGIDSTIKTLSILRKELKNARREWYKSDCNLVYSC